MAKINWSNGRMIEKIENYASQQNISMGKAAEHFKVDPKRFYTARAYVKARNVKAPKMGRPRKKKTMEPDLVFTVPETTAAAKSDMVTILVCPQSNLKSVLEGLWQ